MSTWDAVWDQHAKQLSYCPLYQHCCLSSTSHFLSTLLQDGEKLESQKTSVPSSLVYQLKQNNIAHSLAKLKLRNICVCIFFLFAQEYTPIWRRIVCWFENMDSYSVSLHAENILTPLTAQTLSRILIRREIIFRNTSQTRTKIQYKELILYVCA